MAKHRTRVGLHARNTASFPEPDYVLVREAKIETLKTMSHTEVAVYKRLRDENPKLEFIVRLYDDRLRHDQRPSPADFVGRMVPLMQALRPYTEKFEIHNEPNHQSGLEGWGATAQDARNFLNWYTQVLAGLRQQCPWAKIGFPGLAVPAFLHNDLEWLDICKPAIQASDWLGCHCYWQFDNMLRKDWGLRFQLYHERFPNKLIEITEFGNSTPPEKLPREEMARQYVRYYQELNQYAYLGSASAFIASSPDPDWTPFVWMKEGGEMLPVVGAVRNMERKAVEVTPVVVTPPTEPVAPTPPVLPTVPKPPTVPPPVVPPPTERTFPETGKTVRGAFLQFFERYGLDLCGYPITNQFEEFGRPAQYFQRLALEELKSGAIRLKLVGAEAWTSRDKIAQLEARIKELSEQPPAPGGPVKPAIEDISDQLPKHPTLTYPTRPLADIKRLVVHHTATSPTLTAERIAEYQVRTLGKPGITYHFVVAADGKVYQTNKLETVADHAFTHNPSSVGVCFTGSFMKAVPTTAQIQAGGRLCAWLLGLLRLSVGDVVGLSELVNTQSPGSQWLKGKKWKEMLLAEIKAALEAGGEDQSALIAALREQIEALEDEIEQLKQQIVEPTPVPVPVPVPEPEPGPAKVLKPPIQDLLDKLPKHSTNKYDSRPTSAIELLVVHHSAVSPTVGPKRMAEYHVNNLQWPGLGYHFMVADDGIIYQGNALTTVSYHAMEANRRGVGICFLGNFTKQVPPPAQLRAGAHLVAWLIQELDVALDDVKGHKEAMKAPTACPGAQWTSGKKWKEMLRQEIAKVQQEAVQPPPTPTPVPVPAPGAKPIYHYVLFWTQNGTWAEKDWANARGYIGRFQPSVGFKVADAVQAEYVTIVGGPLGVPKSAEEWLKSQGCKVDRIAGKDEADTKKMLDQLADQGKRFLTFDE